jgi:MFS family permease
VQMLRAYRKVLRTPGYNWFFWGSTIDFLGSEIGVLGLIWFVKELTHSSIAVGSVLAISQVPLALGSLLAGPLLDRGSRRRFMMIDNIGRGLLMLLIPLLFITGALHLWQIYVLVALSGLLSALTLVGSASIIPAMVTDHELLPAANSLNQVQWQIAYLIGPAVGGYLLRWFSPMSVLVVDGITFLLFAIALTQLPARVDAVRKSTTTYWRSLVAGAQVLMGTRALVALTVHTFLFNMAYGPLPVALAFYVDQRLGVGATGLGSMWSAFAAGCLLGGLASGMVGRFATGPTLAVITILWGLLTGPLFWVKTLPLALLLMFLAGASWAPYNVVATTARQRLVPPEAYGRVFGLTMVLTKLGAPVGAWIGGLMVKQVGAPMTLGIAGVLTCVLGLSAWFSRTLVQLDARPWRPEIPVR